MEIEQDGSVRIERSLFYAGDWHDALWQATVVDAETGELALSITSATLGDGVTAPRVVVLRMTMELVRRLRMQVGFGEGPSTNASTPSTNASGSTNARMGEDDDAIEAADAAVYDEFHVEWERDEWRDRAERFETALKEISALEAVDPDGLRWTWKELFTVTQELANRATGVGDEV